MECAARVLLALPQIHVKQESFLVSTNPQHNDEAYLATGVLSEELAMAFSARD